MRDHVYPIVGTNFRPGADEIVRGISTGDKLRLVREPTNAYDPNAIAVYYGEYHIGYIPKKQNAALRAYIDQRGEAWAPSADGGAAMGTDAKPQRPEKSIDAIFVRSPNSAFPQAKVV